MKTILTKTLIAVATLALSFATRAQNEPQPQPQPEQPAQNAADAPAQVFPAPQNGGGESNAIPAEAVGELIQSVIDARDALNGTRSNEGTNSKTEEGPRRIRGQGTRGTTGSGTNAVSLTALVAKNSTNHIAGTTNNLLRLNFRNAPLSLVLDYLSEAAGFTISPDSKVDLKGTVTVWSNKPVTRDEAVALLHKSLTEHNYGATVEGNILNIYVVDASNADIVAGVPGNDYTNIPPTKELITQIVYIHNVEAGQLIDTLQTLMPPGTSMKANQGANAILITDNKQNIRRMVQLVKSLDTASVSDSKLKVFPLTYADATALAQVVQQVFQPDSSQSGRSRGGGFFGGFNPFGGGGPGGDRGSDRSSSGTQAGRVAAKVTAVADDRSNSLVVTASDEQMAMVEELVKQMDVNVNDVTEVRVFRLRYADPQETADQLSNLFPDTTNQQNQRGGSQYGGFGFFGRLSRGGGGTGSTTSTDPNSRKLRQSRVIAVPDPRTGSVIVTAAHDVMEEISGIVQELDSDPAKKKKVYVIKVENRDPQEVVEDLQSVISQDTSGGVNNTRNNSQRQAGSQLNTRGQNNVQNMGNNNNNNFNVNPSSGRTGR